MSDISIRWRDIDLNFGLTPKTKDIASRSNVEAIKQHIKHLLYFEKYDVPFHPEVRAGLRTLVFDNYSSHIRKLCETLIRNQIDSYEPRVKLTDLVVDWSEQNHAFNITLFCIIKETSELVEYKIVLKRLR